MDMDIQAVDEVKTLMLESLKAWKNYKKRNARWSTAGVTPGSRSAQGTSNLLRVKFTLKVLETEEQMLERKQNERDVLDALGDYKCDAGMSVEDVRLLT